MTSINLSTRQFLTICIAFLAGCVPYQQQLIDAEEAEISGFVGPLEIDEEKFYAATANIIIDVKQAPPELFPSNGANTYRGNVDGYDVFIKKYNSFYDPKIIQDKLVVRHRGNREKTLLLWNGRYHQNLKGELIADLIMLLDPATIDPVHRMSVAERKVHDISELKLVEVNFIWIHLIGYEELIRYSF